MDGVQGYIDENGNLVYLQENMMGSEDEDGMHHEGHMDDSYG